MTTTTAEIAWSPLAASTEARWSCQGAHAGETHIIRLASPHLLNSLIVVYLSSVSYDTGFDGQFVTYAVDRQLLSNAGRPNETDLWSDLLEGDLAVDASTPADAEHVAERVAHLVKQGHYDALRQIDAAFAAALLGWDGMPYATPLPAPAPAATTHP